MHWFLVLFLQPTLSFATIADCRSAEAKNPPACADRYKMKKDNLDSMQDDINAKNGALTVAGTQQQMDDFAGSSTISMNTTIEYCNDQQKDCADKCMSIKDSNAGEASTLAEECSNLIQKTIDLAHDTAKANLTAAKANQAITSKFGGSDDDPSSNPSSAVPLPPSRPSDLGSSSSSSASSFDSTGSASDSDDNTPVPPRRPSSFGTGISGGTQVTPTSTIPSIPQE